MTELSHLKNKICAFEDMLLRCKNRYEEEILQKELRTMRVKLQKMEYQKKES